MKHTRYLIAFPLLLFIFNCFAQSPAKEQNVDFEKLSFVKEQLKLSENKYAAIKQKDSVINELYISIKDTVSTALINRRLDSLLLKNYTRKEFFRSLEVDRSIKGTKTTFEFLRNISEDDRKTMPSFDTMEELKAYQDSIHQILKKGFEDQNKAIQDAKKKKDDELNELLALTKAQYEKIREIHVSNLIYKSYKDSVSPTLIKRRLDSLILKSYSLGEFLTSLQLDRRLKGNKVPFEFNRDEDPHKKYKNVDEWAKALKDSIN